MRASLNSYVDAPKRFNISTFIKQKCIDYKIEHNINTVELNRSFLDKLFGIDRGTVYFKLSGDVEVIKRLQQEIAALDE